LSSCVSLKGKSFDGKVSSINTFGSCVKLYGDYNCSGTGGFAVKTDKNSNHYDFDGFYVRAFGSCQPQACTDTKTIETRRTSGGFLYSNPGLFGPRHRE